MPTTDDAVLAAFINTTAIAGEIKGLLFVLLLVLAGFLIVKVMRGDMRDTMQRLAIVAIGVITIGLTMSLLINPEQAKQITETVVNVDPAPAPTKK